MEETYYIWWNIRRALQRYLNTHLVYGHPGDEPRSLKDKDGGDGDGARDAKRLQAGQDLQRHLILSFLVILVYKIKGFEKFA